MEKIHLWEIVDFLKANFAHPNGILRNLFVGWKWLEEVPEAPGTQQIFVHFYCTLTLSSNSCILLFAICFVFLYFNALILFAFAFALFFDSVL